MTSKIPIVRVTLEHEHTGQMATCATLADANAQLTRWSWGDVGPVSADTPKTDTVYSVARWADGTQLVAQYTLPHDVEKTRGQADLGAAIRAQCAYSAGLRRPSTMTSEEYARTIAAAGTRTVAEYERMLRDLEM